MATVPLKEFFTRYNTTYNQFYTQRDEHDSILNAKRVINAFDRHTSFNERLMAFRTSKFNPKLTWDASRLRDRKIITGSGTITEQDGAGVLSTGTTPNSTVELRTRERGQYQSGTEGEVGMGLRILQSILSGQALQGNEEIRWQYCDNVFGFGYGVDSNGIFVFRVNNATFSKTYQFEWNGDRLDGSEDPETNASGINLDLAMGNIFQINFVWYGHGNINFYLNIKKASNNSDNRVLIHTLQVENDLSVVDPNQPISVVLQNDDSGRDLIAYVGGRQFSVVDGNSSVGLRSSLVFRDGTSTAGNTITAAQGEFVPFIITKKKATFRGRNNSINCFTSSVSITTNQKVYWYLSIGDTATGVTYATPPRIPASETGLERALPALDGTANVQQYRMLDGDVVETGNTKAASVNQEARQNLGDELLVVLWIARGTQQTTSPDAYLEFQEEW